MKTEKPAPRIYVACLAAYNNGKLHGEWIDAAQDAEEIREEIQKMLRCSPEPGAEEWAIHDYENFGGLGLGEYEDLETVSRVALLMEEFPEIASGVIDHFGGLRYLDEAEETLRERYRGIWPDVETWAQDVIEDSGDWERVPEHLRGYFDLTRYASDLEISGDIFTIETADGMHIFDGR
jgi:antirestriction protein